MTDVLLERGLPSDPASEMAVLGSVLLNQQTIGQAAEALTPDDFSLEKHRRIYTAMLAMMDEGEGIDAITLTTRLMYLGHLEAIGGVTYVSNLTEGLPRFENIASYCEAVKECARRRHIVFSAQAAMGAALDAGSKASEIAEAAIGNLADIGAKAGGLENFETFVRAYPGGPSVLLDAKSWPRGITTGFRALDEMTTGLHRQELIIIGARPAMGKTAIALDIALHTAGKEGNTVALFSLEMAKVELFKRAVCSVARVDLHRFRGAYLNADERRRLSSALGTVVRWPIYFDDRPAITPAYVRSKCDRLRATKGSLDLVVIDYLQLMESGHKTENRTQEVTSISKSLKNLAKSLDVPVIALSQLSRAPEKRGDQRPTLADLRESGSIEQDADLVLFLFREEVYKPDREDLHGQAELIVSKQRNGPIGKVHLVFLRQYTKFENRADDLGDEAPPAERPWTGNREEVPD